MEKAHGSKVTERAEEAEFGERREPGGWVRIGEEAGERPWSEGALPEAFLEQGEARAG